MARDRSPIVKQSRREGYALHLKAHKYLIKKTGPPGQPGGRGFRRGGRGGRSQYATQLREKQKIRRLYGLLEKQFHNTFKRAARQPGRVGDNTLILLESRLDNAVYRAGFASSRRGARQLVGHKHFELNGRRVNIPSISLVVGDQVKLRAGSRQNSYFKTLDDHSPAPGDLPAWLKVDRKQVGFEVVAKPDPSQLTEEINPQLLVEYYSR